MGKNLYVNYSFKEERSSILKVGKYFMSALGVTSRTQFSVKVFHGKFEFSKQ